MQKSQSSWHGYTKSSEYNVFLFISLSLYGTSIPRKYSIFILFFPKSHEIGSLVVRQTRNCETHDRTMRVGWSACTCNAPINVMPEGGGPRDRVGTLIKNKNLESNFLTLGIRFQFKVPHPGK